MAFFFFITWAFVWSSDWFLEGNWRFPFSSSQIEVILQQGVQIKSKAGRGKIGCRLLFDMCHYHWYRVPPLPSISYRPGVWVCVAKNCGFPWKASQCRTWELRAPVPTRALQVEMTPANPVWMSLLEKDVYWGNVNAKVILAISLPTSNPSTLTPGHPHFPSASSTNHLMWMMWLFVQPVDGRGLVRSQRVAMGTDFLLTLLCLSLLLALGFALFWAGGSRIPQNCIPQPRPGSPGSSPAPDLGLGRRSVSIRDYFPASQWSHTILCVNPRRGDLFIGTECSTQMWLPLVSQN